MLRVAATQWPTAVPACDSDAVEAPTLLARDPWHVAHSARMPHASLVAVAQFLPRDCHPPAGRKSFRCKLWLVSSQTPFSPALHAGHATCMPHGQLQPRQPWETALTAHASMPACMAVLCWPLYRSRPSTRRGRTLTATSWRVTTAAACSSSTRGARPSQQRTTTCSRR